MIGKKYQNEIIKCCSLNKELGESGLVIFTWGNVSIVSEDLKYVFIKPSGLPFKEISKENISVIELKTGIHISGLKPSVDTPIHLSLYRTNPELSSICHSHSHFATVWAQAAQDISLMGTTHADYFPTKIPNIPIPKTNSLLTYEKSIGQAVSQHLKRIDYNAAQLGAVLLRSHGPLIFSDKYDNIIEKSIVLEEVASIAFHTKILQGEFSTPKNAEKLFKFHYDRKHGKKRYYGQS